MKRFRRYYEKTKAVATALGQRVKKAVLSISILHHRPAILLKDELKYYQPSLSIYWLAILYSTSY